MDFSTDNTYNILWTLANGFDGPKLQVVDILDRQ
jgi:hypothetical protein